jgi:hypothetical protein
VRPHASPLLCCVTICSGDAAFGTVWSALFLLQLKDKSRLSYLGAVVAHRVNWRPAKASAMLKSGDIVSCAGKGRLEIGEVSETKKGKFAVELARRV